MITGRMIISGEDEDNSVTLRHHFHETFILLGNAALAAVK